MIAIRTLTPKERLDWLRLARSDAIGPMTCHRLIAHFGSAEAALTGAEALARKGGRRRPLSLCPREAAEREIDRLDKLGAELIAWCEPDYPPALRAIEDAPPILALRGRREILAKPKVGIVGARNASANGRHIAFAIARDLAETGLSIASGFARGIDGEAHKGGLAAGRSGGGSIAAIAGGIDVVYPSEHKALFDAMIAEGLILAEFPPGTQPIGRHFPRRNRIISGLSQAILVIEAAFKSGTLITARYAAEQGREVLVIPGSPLDPRYRGSHRLIREGALLVEDSAQILEAMGAVDPRAKAPDIFIKESAEHIDSEIEKESLNWREKILALLGPSPVEVDELLRQCHCSPPRPGAGAAGIGHGRPVGTPCRQPRLPARPPRLIIAHLAGFP